jgi:hypothetical protein
MLQDSPEDFSINLFLVNWSYRKNRACLLLLCVRPVLALYIPYLALKLSVIPAQAAGDFYFLVPPPQSKTICSKQYYYTYFLQRSPGSAQIVKTLPLLFACPAKLSRDGGCWIRLSPYIRQLWYLTPILRG